MKRIKIERKLAASRSLSSLDGSSLAPAPGKLMLDCTFPNPLTLSAKYG